MTEKDDIAELKREIAALKPTTPPSDLDVAKWRDEQHQQRERRASSHLPFSRADLDAMRAAAPDQVIRGIVRDNRGPTGPTSQGPPSSQQVSDNIRPSGGTPGWVEPVPLQNPPGTHLVDALCRVDDLKQRGARMIEEARRKAAEEAK